jgi:hydroxymethylbilane synthase
VIRLATRGSALALWQAEAVARALALVLPADAVELVTVRTSGDEVLDKEISAIGGTNVFTAEVDRAVTDKRADAGVHSLKDLGTRMAPGLVLGAVLARGPVEDVLVAPRFGSLAALPSGAVVGTGSPRRKAMLLAVRPDLRCVNLRGNVETRISKVERGEVDAAILARAGIERLGRGSAISEVLPLDRFLPAAGQGLVGVTCRAGDARVVAALKRLRDEAGFAAALAERAVLRDLHAGCHAPVGVLASVDGARLALQGRILALDGRSEIAARIDGPAADAELLGARLAADLLARGAARFLEPRE